MSHQFLQALRSGHVLLMDGAMGSELQRLGLRPPQRSEDWNLVQPEAVAAVHRGYVQAGARVLLTNTFQANQIAGNVRGEHSRFLGQSIHSALGIARDAAGPDRFVLLDVGPIVSAGKEFADPRLVSELIERASAAGRLDGILLETCSSSRVRFAVHRARAARVPVLLSMTFRRARGRVVTHDGHAPEWFAERAERWGTDALGVNCGLEISVGDCADIVRRYRKATALPLFARPNAGSPVRDGNIWVYPRSPRAMAAELPEVLAAGASMIGGCCGTTPAHTRAFHSVVERWNNEHRRSRSKST